MPKDKGPGPFMSDEERALIGHPHRHPTGSAVPLEIDSEETPPPRAIDPNMQELIDRFWPLRKIDQQVAAERIRDQERVIKLATDVSVLTERITNISKFANPSAKLEELDTEIGQVDRRVDAVSDELAEIRRHIWGEAPRKHDDPPVAQQARSGRRLLGWAIALIVGFSSVGAGGILVAVRRSADAEGETRAWRAQVNAQIQMLMMSLLRIDSTKGP